MAVEVSVELGNNSFVVKGDVTLPEVTGLFIPWLEAQESDAVVQARIDEAAAALKRQSDTLQGAVATHGESS